MTDSLSHSPATPAETASPQSGMSEGARLIGVFFQPEKTFADIKSNARWWAPFLLLVIVNLGFSFTIDRTIGFAGMAEQSIQSNPKAAEQMDRLPPDARARQMGIVTNAVKYISFASPLMLLLLVLIVATVLLGTFNFGFGRELRFGEVLAVVMYSMLTGVIYTILAMVVLGFNGHSQNINVQNMLATNLAFLMDQSTASPGLYALLRSLDIFYVWPVALSGIGLAAIGGGKRSTTMAVVFTWWLLLVLVIAGWSALR